MSKDERPQDLTWSPDCNINLTEWRTDKTAPHKSLQASCARQFFKIKRSTKTKCSSWFWSLTAVLFSPALKPCTHAYVAIQWTQILTNVSFKLSSQKSFQSSKNNTALQRPFMAPQEEDVVICWKIIKLNIWDIKAGLQHWKCWKKVKSFSWPQWTSTGKK